MEVLDEIAANVLQLCVRAEFLALNLIRSKYMQKASNEA
ncbi:hypothetical protein SAMN05421780_105153 [Flexibacter flexilis DSM 6793]|uniref:Uncharacterized protein n=1 Tax=Flexibacter flexilis DSM 6793 TaxID=927664 RepID=A0A1I1J003_9BACT|nr:hypothetical protein SAMN05421780_105153 [Flexibacter flexilis DSM 6793]